METLGLKDNIGFDNSILNYQDISIFKDIKNIEIYFNNGDEITLNLEKGDYFYNGFQYALSMQNINFKLLEEQYGKIDKIILPVFLEKKFNSDFEASRINEIVAIRVDKIID